MKTLGVYLYSILLSLWIGGIFIFTFIVTPAIFRSYPRDVAGDIVGKLFPSYFLFCVVVSLLSFVVFMLALSGSVPPGSRLTIILLCIAVVVSIYMKFMLYPEIVSVKKEVSSFNAAPADDPIRIKFRTLHAKSAVLNLVLLADGIVLLLVGSSLKKGL